MAAPKGLLGIIATGKPKGMATGEDDEPDMGSEGDSVGKRAAQDVIDAISGKDAAGLYDALERVVRACQGESEEE